MPGILVGVVRLGGRFFLVGGGGVDVGGGCVSIGAVVVVSGGADEDDGAVGRDVVHVGGQYFWLWVCCLGCNR